MEQVLSKLEDLGLAADKILDEFESFLTTTLKNELGGKELRPQAKQQATSLKGIIQRLKDDAHSIMADAKKFSNTRQSVLSADTAGLVYDDAGGMKPPPADDFYDDGHDLPPPPEETYDDGGDAAAAATNEYDDGGDAATSSPSQNAASQDNEYEDGGAITGGSDTPPNTGSSCISVGLGGIDVFIDEPPKAARAIENPDRAGYLKKKHKKKANNFQKRYFVLKGEKLYYYQGEKSSKQKNCICLRGYKPKDLPNERKDKFMIELSKPSEPRARVFVFKASSEKEKADWLVSLNQSTFEQPADIPDDIYEAFEPSEEPVEQQDDENIYQMPEQDELLGTPPELPPPKDEPDVNSHGPLPPTPIDSPTTPSPSQTTVQKEMLEHFKTLLIEGKVKPTELYYAQWTSESSCSNELAVSQGDVVRVRDKSAYNSQGWWVCERSGQVGLVPKLYLQPAMTAA